MTERFEEWAIVELFGHQRIAGRVSEQTVGGCAFVRVDVPALDNSQGLTKLYGQGAIYAMTIVDEQTARLAARACMAAPMDRWSVEQAMKALTPPTEREAEYDGDQEREEDV